ncbi:MAG TPA: MFS transporter, partial [Polyangiaceae bacterium]|nr:MFS transporter [Polyangiaceae bacterium]
MTIPRPAPVCPSEREDRVAARTKFSYALGGTIEIFGHWVYGNLANPVFVTFFGLTPTLVNSALGTTRFVGACLDPLVGWVSDNTRSRWGRRRPFMLAGSVLSGLALPCLFMVPRTFDHRQIFWFMVVSTALYALFVSVHDMPHQSLGAELTPAYHERTSVMSWKAYVQKTAGVIAGAGFSFATIATFTDPSTGRSDMARGATLFAALCGAVMVLSGLLNFFWVKERYYQKARVQKRSRFAAGFAEAFRCRPFVILLGITSMYAIPTSISGALGYYATTYYVCPHDLHEAGNLTTWSGVAYAVMGIGGVPVAARLSRRRGKKWALSCTLFASTIAFASSWWLLTPSLPWLSVLWAGLNGFAATGLWVLLPSMCADSIDFAEVANGKRLEGVYVSTYTSTLKLGMALSTFAVGPLLDHVTRFDPRLGPHQTAHTLWWIRVLFLGIPVAALTVALVLSQLFPLTSERMAALRSEL